jgi:hypothetical protein
MVGSFFFSSIDFFDSLFGKPLITLSGDYSSTLSSSRDFTLKIPIIQGWPRT